MTEKRDKPFKLEATFGEALSRYARVKPNELQEETDPKGGSRMEPNQGELELVHYETPDCAADFTLDPSNQTVWATQQQIADVFGVDRTRLTHHLRDIFADE